MPKFRNIPSTTLAGIVVEYSSTPRLLIEVRQSKSLFSDPWSKK